MSAPVVELTDVGLRFGGTIVLENVSMRLDGGEYLGLIGPNGAGKSVLLKLIAGLLRPDSGTVRVFGSDPSKVRGHTAYVPQYAQFDADFPVRVIDVVLMGRLGSRLFARSSKSDRERAEHALDQVGCSHLRQRQIGKLSGGQLQRVLIARGLAVDAPLFLLDEPTSSLDPTVEQDVYELLGRLDDATIIVVSHDIGVMTRHIRAVACLNRRLHFHHSNEITQEMIEDTYGCPVDMIVHRHTHRVLDEHSGSNEPL